MQNYNSSSIQAMHNRVTKRTDANTHLDTHVHRVTSIGAISSSSGSLQSSPAAQGMMCEKVLFVCWCCVCVCSSRRGAPQLQYIGRRPLCAKRFLCRYLGHSAIQGAAIIGDRRLTTVIIAIEQKIDVVRILRDKLRVKMYFCRCWR